MQNKFMNEEHLTVNGNGGGNGSVPRFGTKRDCAALLQLSPRSVENLMKAGLPYLRIGARRTRFDLNEVRAWLTEKYHV